MNKFLLAVTLPLLFSMVGCQDDEGKKIVPVSKHNYGEILSEFFSSGKTSCETIPEEYAKSFHDFDEASLLYLEATCHSIVAEIDEEAILVILKKAFALAPNDKYGVDLYADLSYSNEGNDAIVKLHKHAIELSPDNYELYHHLAFTYEDMDEQINAIAVYEDGIELAKTNNNNSELVDFYSELGELHQDESNPDNAIVFFKKAIEKIEEPSARLFNLTAMVYDDLDDDKNAIAMYKKAIEVDEKYICAYSNLGYTLINSERSSEARDILNKGLKVDPPNSCDGVAYYNLGVTYKEEDCNIALKYYQTAIDNDAFSMGQNIEDGLNFQIGRCYVILNQADKGIEFLLKDTELSERNFWYLARAYIAKNDYKNASKYLDRAVEEDEDGDFLDDIKEANISAKGYELLAEVYFKRRHFSKAETYHKISTQKDANAALSFARLGLFAVKADDLTKAESLYEKAISIEPKNVDYLRQLFIVYIKNKHCDQAKTIYSKFNQRKDFQKYQEKLDKCSA